MEIIGAYKGCEHKTSVVDSQEERGDREQEDGCQFVFFSTCR